MTGSTALAWIRGRAPALIFRMGRLGLVINWLAGAWLICWSVQLLRFGWAWVAVGLGHAVAGGGCLVRKVLVHNVSHDGAWGQ